MNQTKKLIVSTLATLFCMLIVSSPVAAGEPPPANQPYEIDQQSFRLGTLAAFSEMVGFGVKTLALSSAMTPAEIEVFRPEAEKITDRWNVQLYLETDFMVTDLFSPSVTEGKHLFLVYKKSSDETLDKYQALKKQKAELIATNSYNREAREQIAREFGELLSYPRERIDVLIAKTNAD